MGGVGVSITCRQAYPRMQMERYSYRIIQPGECSYYLLRTFIAVLHRNLGGGVRVGLASQHVENRVAHCCEVQTAKFCLTGSELE